MVKPDAMPRVLNTLQAWSRCETAARRSPAGSRLRRVSLVAFWGCVIVPLAIALGCALVYRFTRNDAWSVASIVMLLVEYAGALVYPFVELFLRRAAIKVMIMRPYDMLLQNVAGTSSIDIRFLPELRQCGDAELRFMRLEIEWERHALEARLHLVTGAVEKVGLLPGLLAIVAILARLGGGQPDWVYAIAYATPVMYVVAAMMHVLILRMERHLKLVDFALDEHGRVSLSPQAGRTGMRAVG